MLLQCWSVLIQCCSVLEPQLSQNSPTRPSPPNRTCNVRRCESPARSKRSIPLFCAPVCDAPSPWRPRPPPRQVDLDKTHNKHLRCTCLRLNMKAITFVWTKCPTKREPQESYFQKCRLIGRFYHNKQHSDGSPIVDNVSTAQDLEIIGVGPTCETFNIRRKAADGKSDETRLTTNRQRHATGRR